MTPMARGEFMRLTANEKRALGRVKARLGALLGKRLKSMRVFGSKARGDAERDSDLDVCILVAGLTREEKKNIWQLIVEVEVDLNCPIAALVMSQEDFNRLKRRQRRIAKDIEREGVPI